MAADIDRQRTISRAGTMEGIGLHTGEKVRVNFKPAEVDTGIVFIRTDLADEPRIPALVENVSNMERGTSLRYDDVEVRTVEHLLSAINGLGIDNLEIEMDAGEVPVADGSALDFFKLLQSLKVVEQKAPRRYLEVTEPVFYCDGEVSLAVLPADALTITYTISFNHPYLQSQFYSYTQASDDYEKHVAPARTFVFEEDVGKLRQAGLIKGGSLENAVVITQEGIMNENLRLPNEFVVHKISDLLGDLMLLGQPLKGRVVAVKSGHRSHIGLIGELRKYQQMKYIRQAPTAESIYDVERLMEILPHRYPFLMVDRITHLEPNKLVVGIKNVTINEPQFTGHFPGKPIMPGVLIAEAMAQCGGILLLSATENPQDNIVYFMSIDDVRFRRPVVPGDCLVLVTRALRLRSRIAHVRGEAYVDGELAAEGHFKAMLVPRNKAG